MDTLHEMALLLQDLGIERGSAVAFQIPLATWQRLAPWLFVGALVLLGYDPRTAFAPSGADGRWGRPD